MKRTLLLVDDEPNVLRALKRMLRNEDYFILTANSGQEALAILEKEAVNVVISDQRMPGMTGSELLSILSEKYPATIRIMLSGYADFNAVIDAINAGAIYKLITKPWQDEALKSQIKAAFLHFELQQEGRFIAKVYENAIQGIVITLLDNKILSVNTPYLQMTGYKESELIGQKHEFFAEEKKDAKFILSLRSRLELEGYWHGETSQRRKNGEHFPVWLAISVIYDDAGIPQQYVYTYIEISDQKIQSATKNKIDGLTGLPTKEEFITLVDNQLTSTFGVESSYMLVAFGLNRFRNINDAMGYHAGDHLLQEIATRLKKGLANTDIICRLGNDEFAILTAIKRDHFLIEQYIDKLHEFFDHAYLVEDTELYITPSVGISIFPSDGQQGSILLENAVTAMVYAKKEKEPHYQRYLPAINSKGMIKLSLENDIHRAINNHEFVLYYQPQLELASNRICGIEALIRWQHPTKGIVAPNHFLPLSEETGLIIKIENWVIRQGFQMAKQLVDLGYSDLVVSINLSAPQLIRTSLLTLVKKVLQETNADPKNIGFEVTEKLFFEDLETCSIVLNSLHRMGFEFSIDDFGTGYSSFENLKQLPFNMLKIDRSFVRSVVTNKKDQSIVRAMITMGKNLGLKVLAEGVEDEEQLQLLQELGCELIQGYHLSKPLTEADLMQFLQSH